MGQTKVITQSDRLSQGRYRSLSLRAALPDPLEPVRAILRNFVRCASPEGSLNFDPPQTDELQAEVLKEIKNLNIDLSSVQKWLTWSCQIAEGFYPYHPMDLKVLITVWSLVIYYVDDNVSRTPEVLHAFQHNLLMGRPQPDPILECLSKVLMPRVWEYYHPLAANAICIGLYEFIQGTALESITKTMKHHSSAPEFPNYVRLKAGAPAPYAYWLFYSPERSDITPYVQIMPDFLEIINWINDILSFYKEELDGEDDNFVHMRAKTSGKSAVAALDQICEETLLRMDRISKTLSESPEHLTIYKEFMVRYLRFHTSTSRYRLKELMTGN
ncbi:hypothetical protein Clacol_007854 [Clathrus columnatus]|uniref:Uncharacterized protein n=1 Tax=Clathrus columnatus TaxID=1419009 RepID=A0AAV5AKI3_9AGAM|nr:hypothetical protein Clacol_007854 [Clathrus columnatus]